jgi:hypothetical protein
MGSSFFAFFVRFLNFLTAALVAGLRTPSLSPKSMVLPTVLQLMATLVHYLKEEDIGV